MKRFRISTDGSSILVVGNEKELHLFIDNEWSYFCCSIDSFVLSIDESASLRDVDVLIEEL